MPLSKEENARGGPEEREAERIRKEKKKGIVRQAKIVFETKEGSKVDEKAGGGKSRGYGFIEYSSHRSALMGLRWLNGHAVKDEDGKTRRLIVEFAIENANVVARRKQMEERSRQRSDAPAGKEGNAAYEARKQKAAVPGQKGGSNFGQKGAFKGKKFDKGDKAKRTSKPASKPVLKGASAAAEKDGEKDPKLALRTKIIARKRQMRKKKAVIRKGK
jgi:nucleolar protein 4